MYKDSLVHGVLGVEEILVQNCQKNNLMKREKSPGNYCLQIFNSKE